MAIKVTAHKKEKPKKSEDAANKRSLHLLVGILAIILIFSGLIWAAKDAAYNRGYDHGFEAGYNDGYNKGYSHASQELTSSNKLPGHYKAADGSHYWIS